MDDAKVIRSHAELMEVVRLRAFLFGKRAQKYVFELGDSSVVQQEKWQHRFEDYYSECGCGVGKVFVAAGLVIALCSLATRTGGIHSVGRNWFLGCLALIFTAALLGKVTGLTIAYVALRRLAREIGGTARALER